MTWWCSASSAPWAWVWRPYPGVWLFVALVVGLYWRFGRPRAEPAGGRPALAFLVGVAILWLALDWPVGALGGYLAAAHAGQFILLGLAAPPFLLVGLRARLAELARASGRARATLRVLAHPLTGLAGFNAILFASHVPGAVDLLMGSQLGSFGIDLAWIAAGLLLWFPAFGPAETMRVSPPLMMGYLFLQTIPSTVPAAFLIFSQFPLFKLYELAPRVSDLLTPAYDHQVAGLLMKTVGDPVIWIGMAVVFFRWANAEKAADRAERGLPKLASRA
jgi:putative membrane protein